MTAEPPKSLYRCDKCGDIVRGNAGRTALGHIHRGEDGEYLGKDAEGRFREFPDDGRTDVEDVDGPDAVWLA